MVLGAFAGPALGVPLRGGCGPPPLYFILPPGLSVFIRPRALIKSVSLWYRGINKYIEKKKLHAVVKPGKSARVVFDLARNFNDMLVDEPFGMASVQDAVDLAMQAGHQPWFAKLDISV